ncbi:MAG: hypothetical protein ACQEXJ_14540 [Myxococcota bacterium]
MPTQRADASSRQFREALTTFEDEVLTPVVPGEVRGWCRDVQRLVEPLREAWRQTQDDHRNVLAQILEDDPELARRVDHLEARERGLSREFERLVARLEEVVQMDATSTNGSWEPDVEARDVRKRLERWMMGCREQEQELRTWMIEALYRDRGTGD